MVSCCDCQVMVVFALVLARQLTMQMMQNPQILAALQERLDGLVGSPSGYMERYVPTQSTTSNSSLVSHWLHLISLLCLHRLN